MPAPQQPLIPSLFDLSFKSLIVPRLIKFFYVLSLAGGAIMVLFTVISTFATGGFIGGLAALIFAPLFYLAIAILVRMQMEMLLVQFEIHRNIARLTKHVTGSTGGSSFDPPADGAGVLHSATNDPSPSGGSAWSAGGNDGDDSPGGGGGSSWS